MDEEQAKKQAYLMELQMAIGRQIPPLIRKYEGQETIPVSELHKILLDAQMFMSSDECMFKHIQIVGLQEKIENMMEINEN